MVRFPVTTVIMNVIKELFVLVKTGTSNNFNNKNRLTQFKVNWTRIGFTESLYKAGLRLSTNLSWLGKKKTLNVR